MHRELEKCERALTEYLDMKKNVFPRFGKISLDNLCACWKSDVLSPSICTTQTTRTYMEAKTQEKA